MDTEYRSRIVITIPHDGNVEMSVDGGGVVEMFAAAALLERAAHKLLAQAERQTSLDQPPPLELARSLPGGLS
jgi:hypothetical protein